MNLMEKESKHSMGIVPKRDIVLVSGKAAKVYDENGKEYIDCATGIGVVNIGHCNPYVAKALTEQAGKLTNCFTVFYNDTRAEYLEKLASVLPKGLDRIFLCNSGAEAVEGAIKFARATTGRTEVIAAMRGFHGRTYGSLSATWKKEYRQPYEPLVPGFKHVPFNNFEKMKAAIGKDTAAIILEIVQGEGGVHVVDADYIKSVRELCNENGIILIIDEVQTGFGRTGRMFACEHFNVIPDIMCLAKSIAGGVPMGAIACCSKINVPVRTHGSTFGGNPLSCAAGLATIKYIQDHGLVEKSRKNGEYFLAELKKVESSKIREIRAIGLMIGIELKEKVSPYLKQLAEKGILALPAGKTVIRLLPPLVITREEINEVVCALAEILG